MSCILLIGCSSEESQKKEAAKLYEAIYQGDLKKVETIQEKTDIDELPVLQNISPQLLAAQVGSEEIALFLLEKGASASSKDKQGMTMLHAAAHHGNKKLASYLLEKKLDINIAAKDGRTPLFEALAITAEQEDKTEMVKWLLEKGADENVVTNTGWTIVHEAIAQKQIQLLSTVFAKVDVDAATKEGLTPLMLAVQENDQTAVSLLLERGASLEKEDDKGYTALCYAASYRLRDMTSLLLQAGADPHHTTKDGQTSIDLAKQAGDEAITALLQSR